MIGGGRVRDIVRTVWGKGASIVDAVRVFVHVHPRRRGAGDLQISSFLGATVDRQVVRAAGISPGAPSPTIAFSDVDVAGNTAAP